MSPIRDLHEDREPRVKAMLLGHVRLGIFNGRHPQQTDTFVFTSADPQRLGPLQQDFGGTVERYEPQGAGEEPFRLISETEAFTALFPFGGLEENVAQSWELWQRAGIQRRCDGFDCTTIDVDELTGERTEEVVPCICAAAEKRECNPTTRVRFLIPQTGLGIWELVTNSRIAATQLWDQGRFIASVAHDRMNHVPVRVVYAPREISYFDEREHKRRTTTKRIVSLSVAGDAERALAPMGMGEDRALIAAVREVLEASGRQTALPAAVGGTAPAALPSASTSPAPDSAPRATGTVPGEASSGDAEGGHPAADPSPGAGDDDGPATDTQWERASQLKLSKTAALRKARELFPDDPPSKWQAMTKGQLARVIEEVLSR